MSPDQSPLRRPSTIDPMIWSLGWVCGGLVCQVWGWELSVWSRVVELLTHEFQRGRDSDEILFIGSYSVSNVL